MSRRLKNKTPAAATQEEIFTGIQTLETEDRATHIREDATIKQTPDFTVTLLDIDEAIEYYFKNIIIPKVEDNGSIIDVPIVYGTPEKWKAMQKDGYYHDQQGKALIPLIMYRRSSMRKNRTLTRSQDANNPRLHYYYGAIYSPKDRYDKFSLLNGSHPPKQHKKVVVPDYVTLAYDCIIWTDYVEHMNKIQEAIEYAESSYWGDKERYQFLCTITDFAQDSSSNAGEDRTIKSTFTINLLGYLVPDALQKELTKHSGLDFSLSKIIFSENLK